MEQERVKSIWWVEKDPWGRFIKWCGDTTGYSRQVVLAAQGPRGQVVLEALEDPKPVAEIVFRLALQRALKRPDTAIITDDPKGSRPWVR